MLDNFNYRDIDQNMGEVRRFISSKKFRFVYFEFEIVFAAPAHTFVHLITIV